jgi:hypothetical protein
MKHWSVDSSVLQKDPEAFIRWQLEQAINFGIRTEKINRHDLRTHWHRLDLDPAKKRFLALILEG